MGLNLARRASRSGATFRWRIEERRLIEGVCAASGAIRKKSAAQSTGCFNLLGRDGTTLLMRVSMGSDCSKLGFFPDTAPGKGTKFCCRLISKADLMKRNHTLAHQMRTESFIF